jgi:hypothetical protein
MRRGRRLSPSPTNNTHKYWIVNRLLCIRYTTLHLSTLKYYQYSGNRRDTLKDKTADLIVTYYITYVHVTSQPSTIRCYGNPKSRILFAYHFAVTLHSYINRRIHTYRVNKESGNIRNNIDRQQQKGNRKCSDAVWYHYSNNLAYDSTRK